MTHNSNISSTDCLDSCGKVLGTVLISKAVKGTCYAQLICDDGTCHTFMTFKKNVSRWVNDKTPTYATNSERLNVAVNYFYFDKELMTFAAERSNYEMHCIG